MAELKRINDLTEATELLEDDLLLVQGESETKKIKAANLPFAKPSDIPSSLPASDVYDWAKQPKKPSYTASEVGALPDSTTIPGNTSQLNNDSGFITNLVTDLANYYTKEQTFTRDEINSKLSTIPKFSIEPVVSLPTENISPTTVYLLKSGDESDNLYTEYIYVDGAWEYLGKQTVDLTGYALKTDIPTKLTELTNDAGYITNAVDNLVNYYDKTAIDAKETELKNSMLQVTYDSENKLLKFYRGGNTV